MFEKICIFKKFTDVVRLIIIGNRETTMKSNNIFYIFQLLIIFWLACSEKFPDQPNPNAPPETHLSFFTTETLNHGTSRQIIHWWGDDPDGSVIGYFYTWQPELPAPTSLTTGVAGWTFTTANSDTFSLRFTQLDTVFTFQVCAVDDEQQVDPQPARQEFPVLNSPPDVQFIMDTDIPETTMTVASFSWTGTDLDGDDTIQRYEWALDDTLGTWHHLGKKTNFLTLTADSGLTTGDHVFYLRAIDNAGVISQYIRMPQLADECWYVKSPQGKVLLLDDYAPNDGANEFYTAVFDSLGQIYSYWDIKADRDQDEKFDLLPPSVIQFRETLKLFDVVVWFADEAPHLEYAQICLPSFLDAGGKILFSTKFKEFFSEQGDPLDFSPADSLGQNIKRLINGVLVEPTAERPELPILKISSPAGIIPFVKTLIKKPSAREFYRLSSNSLWSGNPPIALENSDKSMVFFALPLHLLNGNKNLGKLIGKIYFEDFGM